MDKLTCRDANCNQRQAGSWCSIPSPVTPVSGEEEEEEDGGGREEVLRALPHAHGQAPSEEHVEQVLHLVRHLEAEALADHHVPRAAELLVHRLLDHLRCALGNDEDREY